MDKQDVLDHLTNACAELLATMDRFDETEMTMLSVASAWTIRDILAHISGWAAWDLDGIGTILAGKRPDFAAIQDVDAFNAGLIAERSGWSVGRILTDMEDTEAATQELLADIHEADLVSNELFRGPYWGNLAGWLQVVWEHEMDHAAQIRSWRVTEVEGLAQKV